MPSLWSALSLSSSSSRKRSLQGKGKSKSSNDILNNSATSNDQKRKLLTRQRKLRHVTDDEVGVNSTSTAVIEERSQSWPVSPVSGSVPASGAPTPHHAAYVDHWSKSVVPQPLPRPEMNNQLPQNDSPRRNPSPQIYGKTTDDIVRRTYLSPTYRRRGFPQELHVDTAAYEFDLHFPARSAPGSGYSSPVLSPQRYSTVDLFRPTFQLSSAVESSASDRRSKSYQISPMPTPEHSPLHSPTKHGKTKNSNGIFAHSHKSLGDGLAARPDSNNSNVHPLPLPPPSSSRPSPTMRHNIDRQDFSSIKGQWQRGRPIGRGTYGNVYIATHRETGATCAVKEVEMIPDDPKSEECIKQLEQEIKFLRELKHQNIVQYYGCEIVEDRFCIYLEYVHPGSINKYVQENSGAMTESIIRNFTRHILSGLAYLHSKKTIHRDIKGANLLVNASGVVKLADFGLAKHLTGCGVNLSLKGTPHWMAPEVLQAVMRNDANPEIAYGVDIWSMGCTIVEMMTGKPPWGDINGVQAMFNVLNKAPPIPENLSSAGKDFLQCCFQRRPEDRPSACNLLKHPFLHSSQEHLFAGFVQEFSGLKLHKLAQVVDSACGQTRQSKETTPLSSVARFQQGKLPVHCGETSRQSCSEYPDSNVLPHHSPRSTLEVLPRIPSAELNRCSNSNSPSNAENNALLGVANNDIYNFSYLGYHACHQTDDEDLK
ncbi:mitogen-activated protein kinase kinase kinase 5 [Perilla frutescens var. hirtella]|nr:mitogen-activated protein kinase kinase kinase 5 [Perilla frutescens var. frutescens]KAH6776480.1 mitogen-activated protein kinase kinase kinase 5 [Perilla frutescens var. hirtella]